METEECTDGLCMECRAKQDLSTERSVCFMKKYKKLLACLLAGVMALAMLTACTGGLNTGVMLKGTMVATKSDCVALAEKMDTNLAYSADLCDQAKQVADFLVGNPLELREEKGQLVRITTAKPNNDYTTIQSLNDGRLLDALLDYNCILLNDDYGFGITYEVDDGFDPEAIFYVPKDGTVTAKMLQESDGRTEIGAAYIVTSEATYVVAMFR